jgi:hypothetical protein
MWAIQFQRRTSGAPEARQETHREYTLRCVRMTAINLALRNRYGYVIWGNSLGVEKKLIYRTGFNLSCFVRELELEECPKPVLDVVTEPSVVPEVAPEVENPCRDDREHDRPPDDMPRPGKQLRFF